MSQTLASVRRTNPSADDSTTLLEFPSEGVRSPVVKPRQADTRLTRAPVENERAPKTGASGPRPGHIEIWLGRLLAACVHPFAAWRVLSISWRAVVLAAYVLAGYLIVLGALVVLGMA